jgi:rare lipoprotein A
VPPSRRLVAAAFVCAALTAVPLATGRPADEPGARAEQRLERAQAGLAEARVELERAERLHADASERLEQRLVDAYVAGTPDALATLLVDGVPDALAQLDVIDAGAASDADAIARFRESVARREKAVERLAAERDALIASGAARAQATVGGSAGDAASTTAEATDDEATPAATGDEELSELERLVRDRALPGDAPRDAATDTPIELTAPEGAAAAPQAVAKPYLGAERSGERESSSFALTAAWYGPGFAGSVTASGERYDPDALSAASRTLPLGTLLRLERNGNTVTVRVNDRGPFGRAQDLALSDEAARELDLRGIQSVDARIVPGG